MSSAYTSSDEESVGSFREGYDLCHVCGLQAIRDGWKRTGWWCWPCRNVQYWRSERTFSLTGNYSGFPGMQGHPAEGHVYCSTCGLQSLIHRWADAGWWCWACNNLTYWLREDIVLDRAAPTAFSRVGYRHRINRYVDFCMLCHDTDGHLERDRADYRYNHCNDCSYVLYGAIQAWCITEHNLPTEAAFMILAFLELPHEYRWDLYPHYFRFWP